MAFGDFRENMATNGTEEALHAIQKQLNGGYKMDDPTGRFMMLKTGFNLPELRYVTGLSYSQLIDMGVDGLQELSER